jgi:type IV pilus assembly protein PilO
MALTDSLANVPRPQKIIAGVVGLAIVAGLGYFLLISPKITERATLRQENETLRAEVVKARADEVNLRPFRAQAEALRRRLQAAKERLPSEREMPRLYRQITDLAFQSGLQIALFAPKPQEDRDDVAVVPIAMTCEGGYHQLGTFFTRVGRLPRIVDLGDFRVVGIERPTGTVRAELTLETFVFRPDGAPPPAKPGGIAPPPAGSSTAPPVAPAGQPAAKPGRTGR